MFANNAVGPMASGERERERLVPIESGPIKGDLSVYISKVCKSSFVTVNNPSL